MKHAPHNPDAQGLEAYVYRSNLGDCSNGGISGRSERVWVPARSGHITRAEAQAHGVPTAHYVPREGLPGIFVPDEVCGHLEQGGAVGPMAGGTYLSCSDSRFSRAYGYQPVALHDRVETHEQYRALSQ